MFSQRFVLNIFLVIVFIGLIVWFFSELVLYVIISAVIATIIRPITDYVDNFEIFRIKIPRILAVIISFLILATVPLMFILLFVPLIVDQIHVLQSIDYEVLSAEIRDDITLVENYIIDHFRAEDIHPGFIRENLENQFLGANSKDTGSRIREFFGYMLGFAGKIFVYFLSVSFITFFLLYEKGIIRRSMLAMVPNAYFEVVVTTFYKIEKLLSNYLIGLLLQVGILFTIMALGLAVLEIRYALTIAVFAALINLIPYLGPALGYIFGIIVVISTPSAAVALSDYIFLMIKVTSVFAVAQIIDNALLQPIIFSKSVKAHPLEIFISIFAGAAIAGALGMITAIPVYTILKVSWLELNVGYRQYYIFRTHKEKHL